MVVQSHKWKESGSSGDPALPEPQPGRGQQFHGQGQRDVGRPDVHSNGHRQPGQAAEAARVLGTARDWPVLIEMDERGDYPEVVWEYSDTVLSGEVPEYYREGLGCSG